MKLVPALASTLIPFVDCGSAFFFWNLSFMMLESTTIHVLIEHSCSEKSPKIWNMQQIRTLLNYFCRDTQQKLEVHFNWFLVEKFSKQILVIIESLEFFFIKDDKCWWVLLKLIAALVCIAIRNFSQPAETKVADSSAKANCKNQPQIAQHHDQHQNVRDEHLYEVQEGLIEVWRIQHLFFYGWFHWRCYHFAVTRFHNSPSRLFRFDEENFTIIFQSFVDKCHHKECNARSDEFRWNLYSLIS